MIKKLKELAWNLEKITQVKKEYRRKGKRKSQRMKIQKIYYSEQIKIIDKWMTIYYPI